MSLQPSFEFSDICINRHGGSKTSNAANVKAAPFKAGMRLQILTYMGLRQQSGLGGLTLKQACKAFDKYPNQISGRFTRLIADGLVRKTGEIIDGCAEYEINTVK